MKERPEDIAKKWDSVAMARTYQKGAMGMSQEFIIKQELYAEILHIVVGKGPEPANPHQLPVDSAQGAKGYKQ